VATSISRGNYRENIINNNNDSDNSDDSENSNTGHRCSVKCIYTEMPLMGEETVGFDMVGTISVFLINTGGELDLCSRRHYSQWGNSLFPLHLKLQ
jgi:hypothetical protein